MASDPTERHDDRGREKVACMVCGAWHHNLTAHLRNFHAIEADDYRARYPRSPIMSDAAIRLLPKKRETIGAEIDLEDVPEEPVRTTAFVAREEPEEVEEDPYAFKIGCARLYKNPTLTPEQKVFVPKFDQKWEIGPQETENLEFLALGMQKNKPVLIVGPTGCGKTFLVSQLAAVCARPVFRINLNGDVRAADFVGDKTVTIDSNSGQSVIEFKYGILPNAMKAPAWLLIDEIDAGQAHILFVLQAVLEKERRLVLTSNYGEVIVGQDGFNIIATANTLGKGDDTGLYAGTNMLNEALLDRFPTVLRMEYPDEATEVRILHNKTGLNRSDCAGMVEIANQVRTALAQELVYCTFGTRRLINWAEMAVDMGNVARAARPAILNRLSIEDEMVVAGFVQRKFGSAGSIGGIDRTSIRARIKERKARDKKRAGKPLPEVATPGEEPEEEKPETEEEDVL